MKDDQYIHLKYYRSNVKYILRTDIMYEKESGNELDAKEEEALQLIQEAERLEVRKLD